VLDLARADHPHITNTGTGQPDYADMGAYEIVTAWYVDANADPNGNGLAWTHAFQNLQNALDAARAGDLVLVADGDYTGPQNRNLHFNGKALTLRSVNGPSHCVIDAQGQSRVFQIGPADIGSRVEGFTIKGGDVCEGGAGVDCTGGSLTIADCVLTNNRPYALHCSAATSLTLQDCTLSNGTTGLRAVDQAQVQLDHCTITSHLYDGITVTDQACVTLNDSTIADNREGVHAVAGSVRLTACTIKDNREYGLYTNTTDPNVTDCTFTANGWGSTTYPAVYCGGSQYAQFVRCQLTDNIGPGLYCWGSSVTFERGRITGNGGSGVILATGDTSTIIQSVIANNAGDGVTVEDSSPTVTNCTVADNTSAGVRSAYSGSPTINNTILWSNGDDDLIDCSASYTCVQDYHAANNNLPGPPHFVDPNVADYHLQPWSSCIDAGDPASACDAEPGHTPGNTINLGAYGNTDEATQRSDADTDTDGLYDAWEQHYWPGSGLAAQDANSDPDGDGLVNLVEQQVGWNPTVSNAADVTGTITNQQTGLAYATIAQALQWAQPGQTVSVGPGTYHEQLDFNGKNIVLQSTDPTDPALVAATVIDGDGRDALTFSHGETSASRVVGLTVTGALRGVSCDGACPRLEACIITHNDTGLYCTNNANPTCLQCVFFENSSDTNGGAVCSIDAAGTFTNCLFAGNTAATGGACYISNASPTLTNCTFFRNRATNAATGRGGALYCDNNAAALLVNCILTQNTAAIEGDELYNDADASATFAHCAIEAGLNGDRCAGQPSIDNGHNLAETPSFVDTNSCAGPDGLFATRRRPTPPAKQRLLRRRRRNRRAEHRPGQQSQNRPALPRQQRKRPARLRRPRRIRDIRNLVCKRSRCARREWLQLDQRL